MSDLVHHFADVWVCVLTSQAPLVKGAPPPHQTLPHCSELCWVPPTALGFFGSWGLPGSEGIQDPGLATATCGHLPLPHPAQHSSSVYLNPSIPSPFLFAQGKGVVF